jgi:hypothetical protein
MSPEAPKLILATTCADRKSEVATGRVSLKQVQRDVAPERARAWASLLASKASAKQHAGVLYQGDHWSASERALDAAKEAGFAAEFWVISAGYGLYPVEAAVTSYEATFSPGHKESVSPPGLTGKARDDYLRDWWTEVAKVVRVPEARARTFRGLAKADPNARFLVIAGQHYLDAIAADVHDAQQLLKDPDQLAVVSGGASSRTTTLLGNSVLPVDARLEHLVAGTRNGLNARVAAWLLSQIADPTRFSAGALRSKLEAQLAVLPDVFTPNRETLTDEQVKAWIHKNRNAQPSPSATGMLRALRESGKACEQSRFKRLFQEAMEQGRGAGRG